MKKMDQKEVASKAAEMISEAGYKNYVVGILEPKNNDTSKVVGAVSGYQQHLINLLNELKDEVEGKSNVDVLKRVAEILDDILGKDK